MGSFFTDTLSFQHETAVFDVNPHQLRFVYNTYRFTTLEEIKEFEPVAYLSTVSAKRAMIMSIPAMVTRMATSFL